MRTVIDDIVYYARPMIAKREGCKLTAYQDQGGVWTIGYGHTGHDLVEGLTITQARANELFQADLSHFIAGVQGLVTRKADPKQIAALVSFAYNLGLSALEHSTLLKFVNVGQDAYVPGQFLVWNHVNHVAVLGLTMRRLEEAVLYMQGV